jgi:hypothetical protein
LPKGRYNGCSFSSRTSYTGFWLIVPGTDNACAESFVLSLALEVIFVE